MNALITPARKIRGHVLLPGDKSISHRLAMLGAIAKGQTVIENFASSRDCHSTLSCLSSLGVSIERKGNSVTISGAGLAGLQATDRTLDAENSGSTLRMLSGILAGQEFLTKITGDDSLRRRPMGRIIDPLTQMGATIEAREGNYPPLVIKGGPLKPIRYTLPIASAQVKSAILLAGLYAEGETEVMEPISTRNHTELALRQFGCEIDVHSNKVRLKGRPVLNGIRSCVPGDISSAAFFVTAASLLTGSDIVIENVGVNLGRRGLVDLLQEMGAAIQVRNKRWEGGEPVGDLNVQPASLKGGKISGVQIPQIIDEIPVLAVLATQTLDGLEIRDAGELRVKESDRIKSIVLNLRAMGADVEEFPDGMFVPGRQSLRGAPIHPHGDHRIAMAFAVAGLLARGETLIEGAECASVSFPNFFETLESLVER